MTKKRTMNELRQEKPYGYKAPFGMTHEEEKSKVGKDIAGDKDLIEAAKEQIIKQLQDDFYDVIFQAVADKMSENYMFRENNYLTEAGMDEFEDAWFEWYHNHHGDILSAVLKNLGH